MQCIIALKSSASVMLAAVKQLWHWSESGTFHSIRCRMHWPGSTLLLKTNPDAIVVLAAEIRSH